MASSIQPVGPAEVVGVKPKIGLCLRDSELRRRALLALNWAHYEPCLFVHPSLILEDCVAGAPQAVIVDTASVGLVDATGATSRAWRGIRDRAVLVIESDDLRRVSDLVAAKPARVISNNFTPGELLLSLACFLDGLGVQSLPADASPAFRFIR